MLTKKKTLRILTICDQIQELGWIQLEYTAKIIMVTVENCSFGYSLTIGTLVKRGIYHRCWNAFIFLRLPGESCTQWNGHRIIFMEKLPPQPPRRVKISAMYLFELP